MMPFDLNERFNDAHGAKSRARRHHQRDRQTKRARDERRSERSRVSNKSAVCAAAACAHFRIAGRRRYWRQRRSVQQS